MLKGHVFSKQLFGNPIFALFINTFLDGKNGISDNYKNGMEITYSGSNLTVDSGAVCIQGRFLEEDTSTTIVAGTDTAYCKLVIEIDLDKQNTESEFIQGTYKILKNSSAYPTLTQTNIVKNNSGIYQYELARFKTSTSGILDFQDMRTFLDFDSIYSAIETEYRGLLEELKEELKNVKDGSAYLLKSESNTIIVEGTLSEEVPDEQSSLKIYYNPVTKQCYMEVDITMPVYDTGVKEFGTFPSEYIPKQITLNCETGTLCVEKDGRVWYQASDEHIPIVFEDGWALYFLM